MEVKVETSRNSSTLRKPHALQQVVDLNQFGVLHSSVIAYVDSLQPWFEASPKYLPEQNQNLHHKRIAADKGFWLPRVCGEGSVSNKRFRAKSRIRILTARLVQLQGASWVPFILDAFSTAGLTVMSDIAMTNDKKVTSDE